MPKQSAGLLLYRKKNGFLEVFLIHPGGPFWRNKDKGAWSIPKGEFVGEPPLEAAKRELKEETGFTVRGPFIELTPIKQKGGKWVHAWATEADVDPKKIKSNTFTVTYASGHTQEVPEVDKADWFRVEEAKEKILEAQARLVDELVRKLGTDT
ncbi:MAG TPA: NUDIX domain-containing protein [Pyrinomonadaceae bacterium]|nr:NUDIX domain-containing protein [Pyrinomonadaceae bacterium]